MNKNYECKKYWDDVKGAMFARRAPARYLSINYPDFSPRFTL